MDSAIWKAVGRQHGRSWGCLKGVLGGLERSWMLLGRSLSGPGGSWKQRGHSWGGLGVLLGALGAVLEASWACLGRSWGGLGGILSAFGAVLGVSWALLGLSWALLRQTWRRLGCSCRCLCQLRAVHRVFFVNEFRCFSMLFIDFAGPESISGGKLKLLKHLESILGLLKQSGEL